MKLLDEIHMIYRRYTFQIKMFIEYISDRAAHNLQTDNGRIRVSLYRVVVPRVSHSYNHVYIHTDG